MEVYILFAECECEDYRCEVLGVFSSEDAARSAIPVFDAMREERSATLREVERREKEYLASHFKPRMVSPSNPTFPDGLWLYTNEQYAEAQAAVGPYPALLPPSDNYEIVAYDLDSMNY